MILVAGLGEYADGLVDDFFANRVWRQIHHLCRKEISSYWQYTHKLVSIDVQGRFLAYLRNVVRIDEYLSALEIACLTLTLLASERSVGDRHATENPLDALDEINARFEQHGVGYQFENGQIIRVDSKLTHKEIIKPALALLTANEFSKANDDFMTAHRHYRDGEFKSCVTAAGRAFESMLKAICETEHWTFEKGARGAELVSTVSTNGLFTHDFDKSFASYIAMMKTGLPTVRNEAGGHGEGISAAAVTVQVARFAINLTATNLLFLGECYDAYKRRPKR